MTRTHLDKKLLPLRVPVKYPRQGPGQIVWHTSRGPVDADGRPSPPPQIQTCGFPASFRSAAACPRRLGYLAHGVLPLVPRSGIVSNTTMVPCQVVIDTNVVFAALLSNQGASYKLHSLVGIFDQFKVNVSVPLVLEYEDVLKRDSELLGLTHEEIDQVLDYLSSVAKRRPIFFLWRAVLRDPKDEFVLEVAVEGGCEFIITYKQRDFFGIERFGLRSITPCDFLRLIEVLP